MFFLCLFTLCSARAIALVIVLSESPRERIGKWETCPTFEREQIIGLHLTGASVSKVGTSVGVLRETVPQIVSAYGDVSKEDH
jgi:hypothetical protein